MIAFTAVAIVWGLGILVLCAFCWGTQHTEISAQTARGIRVAALERAHHERNSRA
jgi:hypothetical protein